MYTKALTDYALLRELLRTEKDDITEQTNFLPDGIPFKQRLWHLAKDVNVPVQCCECSIPVKWNIAKHEYRKFCSNKCATTSTDTIRKRKDTCLEKFGAITNLLCDHTKQQIKDTLMKKYGVDNISKSEHFRTKSKATFMATYGVDNPSKSPAIKKKISDSHFEKYGRKRSSQQHIDLSTIALKDNKEWLGNEYLTKTIEQISDELGVSCSQLALKFHSLEIPVVNKKVSMGEQELHNFVESIYNKDIIQNDRTILSPKELDIYLPSDKVAIEYNGLYWHTEKFNRGMMYHENKRKECAKQGIHLIQIWDYEWLNNAELVKSRIKAKLGLSKKIYARKCKIKELSFFDAKQFNDANHIQHNCPASVRYGMYHAEELIGVMTFGKSRYNKKYEYELLRYCTKQGVNITGGASKLFTHFLREVDPMSVISYSDKRWNTGSVYAAIGFSFIKSNNPSYHYTNGRSIENRVAYQKHKLKDKLDVFDPELSEWQNMQANGYDRIWDCGTDVFTWNKD